MANCASVLFGCGGCNGDDYGPNCMSPNADDIWNCWQTANAFGGSGNGNSTGPGDAALISQGMSCYDETNDQQTARSLHFNGVNVCLATAAPAGSTTSFRCFPAA